MEGKDKTKKEKVKSKREKNPANNLQSFPQRLKIFITPIANQLIIEL